MTFAIRITFPGTPWKTQMAGLSQRLNKAITLSMNMVASMLLDKGRADIASAGNFGPRWTEGLKVITEGVAPNMRLYFKHDIPYAGIFETGGVIQGKPLLWIPISGTDAVGKRASTYGGLFSSATARKSGPPLLFAASDRKPKYFGIESVTIPRKFHLTDDVTSVMSDFRTVFDNAWKAS